jgi:transposase
MSTSFLIGHFVQNPSPKYKRTYRRHDLELKRHLATLCCEPGASVAAIAREHGINANMLFMWRKQYALGTAADLVVVLPVQVQADGLSDEVQSIARPSPRTVRRDVSVSLIEIELSGVLVRLRGTVDEATRPCAVGCASEQAEHCI